ncbi:hypothetical protein TL10_24910 [Mycolicibacterium llatzerense]|uniref:Uncharacterized protein n=1 Tax=Mycolicibacterium llatzerense TaxID=280871 RepID=A0A0D1LEK3_9MYCO|nr:hypothetical protein TL10_24910 [Mycolicibacterium llatzerense]
MLIALRYLSLGIGTDTATNTARPAQIRSAATYDGGASLTGRRKHASKFAVWSGSVKVEDVESELRSQKFD